MDAIATGIHSVRESLLAGMVERVFLARNAGPRARRIADKARKSGVNVEVLSPVEFSRLGWERNAQGIAARLAPFEYADMDDVQEALLDGDVPLAVALDLVKDTGNLGSVLRTAAFFGLAGVIIPKDRAAGVTPSVIRASAGGAFSVSVARVTNLARTLRRLKDAGATILGGAASGGMDPASVDVQWPCVLVLGSEDKGLRRLVGGTCDAFLTIESPTGFESLNVGVSAGILVHALVSRLRRGKA